jgi:hypothetical protein
LGAILPSARRYQRLGKILVGSEVELSIHVKV